MTTDPAKQRILDEEHLRLLSMFHYISGTLTILFSCIFIIHLTLLGILMSNPEMFGATPAPEADARSVFVVMFYIFLAFILLGIAYGIIQIISGRCLARHRYRTFSLVAAIPNTLLIPYGTILGVMTLVVLGRESIKVLYAEKSGG
ncbi:MAG: hypothetical protein A2140_08795 [Candidatus Muproteobacteria bacterium RBG_16_62_13]|uniref:Uncharacterized protein n=1 Tax=Candidatus Muproteobacteria bacterium RBG_16_62_13 TaxID=1817756 RepID=A0A1F6T3R3_9PROT|nr:MAG: hypothetical protein A2140_08795 [Candidatus Muproteobacteria bacterium RBG_16_62_13]